ncbi:MAG: AI-2E family transporter, partial [Burkholderiaceae bacterium]
MTLTPVSSVAANSRVTTVVLLVAAIAALYFGREILIPVALAGLLSFLLEPMTTRLRRWGLARSASVVLVVALVLISVGALGTLVGKRVIELAENVPTYQNNIRQKIRSLQTVTPGANAIDRAQIAVKELGEEIKDAKDKADAQDARKAGRPVKRDPLAVRVERSNETPLEMVQNTIGPFVGPVGTAGLVIVFLIFMLFQQEDIRDRFIRIVGGRDMSMTTRAIADAADRVSRYLRMQLIVNVTYGVPIGLGLFLIGVPSALLWGLFATLLRFVPYVGPFIAAMFPLVLAVAVDPGWSMVAWTIGLFVFLELISNNVIEPWLYGSSTGLSPVAIILAAIFWTTLWGPAGLLLSTPLTVCLVVLGRYVPQLQFLFVLLGDAPALTPAERLYQRMLADDTEEGEEMAAAHLKRDDPAGFHDEVTLPALRLAEADRRSDTLPPDRAKAVSANVQQLLDDVAEADEKPASAGADKPLSMHTSPVLCVGGRSALDTAAAAVLARRLLDNGIAARVATSEALGLDELQESGAQPAEIIALVYLGPTAVAHARQQCRRLRQKSSARILVGLFNEQLPQPIPDDQRANLRADCVAMSPAEALKWIAELAGQPVVEPMMPAPLPANEEPRLAELKKLKLLDTPREETFDRITEDIKEALGMPIALVSLIDEKRQFWKASAGLSDELTAAREAPRETSICGHVVAADELLVIEDVARDPRFANNPFLSENGIRFYAGAPLRTESGLVLGALCVMDTRPHRIGKP